MDGLHADRMNVISLSRASKQIKYIDLVANAIMLHNVVDLTGVLNDMVTEGTKPSKELLAGLSPFIRDQIRRFWCTMMLIWTKIHLN